MTKNTLKYTMYSFILLFFGCFLPSASIAQTCGFSSGKSIHELQLAIHTPDKAAFSAITAEPRFHSSAIPQYRIARPSYPERGVFLPRWSADDLPFFCKIEHNWAKNHARIPVKFRLGSVEYVDWLEGKTADGLR